MERFVFCPLKANSYRLANINEPKECISTWQTLNAKNYLHIGVQRESHMTVTTL